MLCFNTFSKFVNAFRLHFFHSVNSAIDKVTNEATSSTKTPSSPCMNDLIKCIDDELLHGLSVLANYKKELNSKKRTDDLINSSKNILKERKKISFEEKVFFFLLLTLILFP